MLLTNRLRFDGIILANTSPRDPRARFTVAHELGHFLMEHHIPSDEAGTRRMAGDFKERRQLDLHFRQEFEANNFAIEPLAPSAAFNAWANIAPDLDHVRNFSDRLDLKTGATMRRDHHAYPGRRRPR